MDTAVHDLQEDARKLQVQLDDVWLVNAKLRDENAALRAALRELVACKDLQVNLERGWPWFENYEHFNDTRNALMTREPKAWTAARALVEPQ